MTTTVKIEAHCSADKLVMVEVTIGGIPVASRALEDGQSTIEYAYDDRTISVREIVAARPVKPDVAPA